MNVDGVTSGDAAPGPGAAPPSGAPPVGDIARRPEIEPEMLAVLVAAVDQAWPRPRVVVAEEPVSLPAWRFSGRWWSRPATVRRDRPRG
ncbi:MAG TPA: hypothetical protein VG032_10475 [Acidimicrobiales bacterium]|nr:hypothetical protein [Acidimicrobiales bacterium]